MIFVTGASGSIGSRLVDRLRKDGEPLRIGGRRPEALEARWPELDARELDVHRPLTVGPALAGVTAAYYLVHSMEPGSGGAFSERDADGAGNFARAALDAGVERVVYLGGLGEEAGTLSEHLLSRHETGRILAAEGPPLLEFRAAMVISSDSASYRMLMDLVDRLPVMVVPRWVDTPSQPIAIDDVLAYLVAGRSIHLGAQRTVVEIGGPDVITYRRMIEAAAGRHGRSPLIVGVPFFTPRLSSYWCGLTTDVPAALARPLIEGMGTPMLVHSKDAEERFPSIHPIAFREAMERAEAGS